MTHVITRSCCSAATCIPVCPVNCIHPTPDEPDFGKTEMLYIDPAGCVDCGACVAVCPVGAITHEYELTPAQEPFQAINALWFEAPGRADYSREPMPLTAERWQGGELRVAIVGSGPSAFYAADELLTQRGLDVSVHMFERLPVPGGLVRFGVAPDHQDTKSVDESFATTMKRKGFRLFLDTEIGRDVTIEDLTDRYHAVIVATGAPKDRALGIPGEDLTGSHSASDFVAWYNGHPDHAARTYDLSAERAVVIGNGNVALDVARILASDPERLAGTDIADHALTALRSSRINEVVVIGRRGPAQAAFSAKELLGLLQTEGISVEVDDLSPVDAVSGGDSSEVDPTSAQERAGSIDHYKLDLLASAPGRSERSTRTVSLRFLAEPTEIVGHDAVEAIRLRRNVLTTTETGDVRALPTNDSEELACGLVFRSIGFLGEPLAGLPFDAARTVIPNVGGAVTDATTGSSTPGIYVTGWIKRGPSGVIGTNKTCAQETVGRLLGDFREGRLGTPKRDHGDIEALLPDHVAADGWQRIDAHERALGRAAGRPRVKLVDTAEMRDIACDRV